VATLVTKMLLFVTPRVDVSVVSLFSMEIKVSRESGLPWGGAG
jgi:hypothetical protein